MNIAEFFINIGMKGDEAVRKGLKGIGADLGSTKNMSLEAKAAILGVLYGLERLTSHSNDAGAGLKRMSDMTGLSTQMIQKYQYAARTANATNEDVAGSFESLYSKMVQMVDFNKGPIEGLERLSQELDGGLDWAKIGAKDVEYLTLKMQEYYQIAKKSGDVGVASGLADTMGFTAGMKSAMFNNVFQPKILNQADPYSEGQINSLSRQKAKWTELGETIEKMWGKINAEHGDKLITNIGKIAKEVGALVKNLMEMADKLKIFQVIAGSLNLMAGAMKYLNGIGDTRGNMLDRLETESKLGIENNKGLKPGGSIQNTSGVGSFLDSMVQAVKDGAGYAYGIESESDIAFRKSKKNDRVPQSVDSSGNTYNLEFNIQSDSPQDAADKTHRQFQNTLLQLAGGAI